MAVRIFAAGLVAASLLVAPAFAQTSSTSTTTGMTPAHTESTTTTTNKTTSDTDAAGKTVTHHHKVVKHKAKASKKMSRPATTAPATPCKTPRGVRASRAGEGPAGSAGPFLRPPGACKGRRKHSRAERLFLAKLQGNPPMTVRPDRPLVLGAVLIVLSGGAAYAQSASSSGAQEAETGTPAATASAPASTAAASTPSAVTHKHRTRTDANPAMRTGESPAPTGPDTSTVQPDTSDLSGSTGASITMPQGSPPPGITPPNGSAPNS